MSEKRNINVYQKSPIKFTKSKISKIISAIISSDIPKYLFENINKLFMEQDKGEQFLMNLFSIKSNKQNEKDSKDINDNKYSIKLKELIYILIIHLNYYFFDTFTREKQIIFNEQEFINECFKKSMEIISNLNYNNNYGNNNNLLFHKYFCIITYFILRCKYKKEYNKNEIENIIKCLNNSELNEIFTDIYSSISSSGLFSSDLNSNNNDKKNDNKKSLLELNIFQKYNFISKLINNYSTNSNIKKSNIDFSTKDLNNFYLYINKSKYSPLFNNIDNHINNEAIDIMDNSKEFLYLDKLKSINSKLHLLYKERKKLTKILFYGEKCSGKATLGKKLLNNPLIIDIDESLETNYLLGEYLINEFSEIIWEDGILLSALKQGKDIILLSMEKCGNDFICILKQILENNSLFIPSKQETLYGFESKIIMIYNLNNTYNKKLLSVNPLFNFLSSNSHSFKFEPYNNQEIIDICAYKYDLNKQETNILSKLISVYNSIPSHFKINTRYKPLSLNDAIYNAELLHNFFIKKDLIDMDRNSNDEHINISNEVFINEMSKMNLVSLFIYHNLLTIENVTLLKSITDLYSTEFNFNSISFNNIVFNLEEKYTFSNSEFNYIKTFNGNKIFFDNIPKGDFYSYNTNSKFYIKLINEFIFSDNNVLLVGETGVGKTRMIQNLSKLMNIKLNVINMSQSSDEGDLLGGFKPISTKNFLKKYFDKILSILSDNFNSEKNQTFIQSLYKSYNSLASESNIQKELYFVKFAIGSLKKLKEKIKENNSQKNKDNAVFNEIDILIKELNKFMQQLNKNGSKKNSFKYLEGILLQAIKNDEWILLDEINLANDNILLKLKSILEGNSIFIMNNNVINEYYKKKYFRIFGSMNPEYNVGKKRLPSEIREFFKEIFINEISSIEDINNFIIEYLQDLPQINENHIQLISNFYIEVKKLQNNNQIFKANGNKTSFSLRTLTRALVTIRNGIQIFKKTEIAIYESLSMNFISQMDNNSKNLLKIKYSGTQLALAKEIINKEKSDENKNNKNNFILTPMFINHLETLIQIVYLSDYAVLLEGPTSCGKTSIVEYLAKCLNQKILRINNNQNTEVEEYLGSYTTDVNGNFYFNEGFLVKAVKEGFWIILDEINLAPSEVLEALNRLLDDNRELYLPESNKVIKAHKNFRIFAAMNPSETYTGRKDLSDAFKNRFIHLFFNNIPNKELISIIQKRCEIPLSRAEIMINIFSDLQMVRSQDKIFQKNEGFITIRDLIKWGSREIDSYEKLAMEGFILLGEKLSNKEDKEMVRKIIEKNLKQKKIKLDVEIINKYYEDYVQNKFLKDSINNDINKEIKFTKSIERIITLVDKAISNNEAVLLIGDTGTGKTLSIEYLAKHYKRKLTTINCHENMDTNDFLGSLRSTLNYQNNDNLPNKSKSLFEWVDGPITSAMKEGYMVIMDEIVLVIDSVLERMNSIFEADSVLVLSEKNLNDNVEIIHPHKNFCIIGTICPSVSEGKKELSQALRARFTEIYIPQNTKEDINTIIEYKVSKISYIVNKNLDKYYTKMLYDLYIFYNELQEISKPMSYRDIDIICEFIQKKCDYNQKNNIENNDENIKNIFYQAIQMTIIEGLYLNESLVPELLSKLKESILNIFTSSYRMEEKLILYDNENYFGVNNFILNKKYNNKMKIEKYDTKNNNDCHEFIFDTETLKNNLLKIIRGMFIKKPILIEGSPGIGKTTIVQNLAKKLNKKIHRINLSEHTDMIDLVGSQFPTSDNNIKFRWVDGVLLTAMKNGDWIIIDEMNLANQSILEGLNSVLDSSQCLFVPELNLEINAHPDFQIFATQNPVNQGGGRKFLPKNFLNRFIKIYLDELNINDYKEILEKIFINNNNTNIIKKELIEKLVDFNERVKNEIKKNKISLNEVGEFNLRTMIKFLNTYKMNKYDLMIICNTFYLSRIRNLEIKKYLLNQFIEIFFENKKECNDYISNIDDYLYNNNNYSDEIRLCIENNYPIIVSGEGSIGKKHLIKSKFSNKYSNNINSYNNSKNNLNSFFLYSTMDSSELLGNFDKSNINYQLNQYINNLKINKDREYSNNPISFIDMIEKKKKMLIEKSNLNSNEYNFEWHDSILINSIINGDLIILDNANTCNNAVLDRLNSLLDDDKKIYLNESGENRVIQPNNKFRIFLTMNPFLGEVSRALKNRCVELYYTGHKILFISKKEEQNSFNINGNFNIITLNLFEFGIININTNFFFDLINLCELPFYLSFDIFIIYLINEIKIMLQEQEFDEGKNDKKENISQLEIKFNFNKYKKCIELIKYYTSQGYCLNYSIANALFIMDNNFENSKDNFSIMAEKYIGIIHDYFISILEPNSNLTKIFKESINLQIFFLYYLNINYNSDISLKSETFIHNFEYLLDINNNIMKYREKNIKKNTSKEKDKDKETDLISSVNSNSFLFNNYNLLNSNNSNFIISLYNIIMFLEANQYNVEVLFALLNNKTNNKNNILLPNEIKKYFNYSYDKLNLGNLIKYSFNTILNIESLINQYKKIIDYNYENDLISIFKEIIDNKIKSIEKNELVDYKYFLFVYIKLSFLYKILSDESNKLFIRQNSDIFIFIIKKIFMKFQKIFYGEEKMDIIQEKNKSEITKLISKIKIKMSKNYFENCLVKYNNINYFSLVDKYISIISFSYDSKNCEFNLKIPLNKDYLNKLFNEIVTNNISISTATSSTTLQKGNQNLLPYINNNDELINLNSLIQLLLNSTTYINDSINSIIKQIFSYNVDAYNQNMISQILNYHQILDNKNLYIFMSNISDNNCFFNENESIIKDIYYDLVKLMIIDEYKSNIINKIYGDNNKNLIISNIEELVKENKILLYIYPYLYFYVNNNINNLDIIFDALEMIEMFDISKYIDLLIEKYQKKFNMNFSEILKEFKPTKNKIYKLLSKSFVNKFDEFKDSSNKKFNFAYELVNHKSLQYKVNKDNKNKEKNEINDIKIIENDMDISLNITNDEIKSFTSDIDKILQSSDLPKDEMVKFISKYIIKFSNIIFPYIFFVYVSSLKKYYNNNNIIDRNKNVFEDNMIEEYKTNLINEYNKCTEDKKIEFLIFRLNKYNKDIIKNIYFDYYNKKKIFIKNNNDGQNIKVKKYVSLNELVMGSSHLIGDKKNLMNEKEIENKEIKEYFPTYENEIDIFRNNINDNNEDEDIKKIDNNEQSNNVINYVKSFILLSKINSMENNELYFLINENEQNNNVNSEEYNEIDSYIKLLESSDTNSFSKINNISWYYDNLLISKKNNNASYNRGKINNKHINENNTKKYIHDLFCYYISSLNSSKNFASSSLLSLNQEKPKQLSINNKSDSPVSYNFYKSPSPKNILMLYYPINMLISKCQTYFEKYPNHPILINILFVSNTILSLDINITPLSKVLSVLDILITNIHEWEQYASRSINSLFDEQTLIMKLIRYYRFIEIQSWKNFLAFKEKSLIEDELNDNFEYLIDLIMEYNNTSKNDEEKHNLLDTLNIFLLSSNLGNFVIRLNEVKIIADLTGNNLIKNLYGYYYINYIQSNKFQKYKKSIIDDVFLKIKSLIKINKFDIRNYLNFRDNMRRNYKQLNKLLKQNENLYRENDLNTIILNEQKEQESKEYLETFINENLENIKKLEKSNRIKNNVFSENFYSVLNRMKTLFNLKKDKNKNSNANYKQKFILDIIKKLQSMGMSKNYKYYQKKVFQKIMSLKLEKNNVESSYLCKILNKINNYMNLSQGKITKELNNNYIERMKGLILSFYDKCLTINKLLIEIKQNRKKLELNKYIYIITELSKNENNNIILNNEKNFDIKNKIKSIVNACNDFLMSFNFKDFHLVYCSENKINENNSVKLKFLEGIQSVSFKVDNIIKYLEETENNFELHYVVICFVGIKNIIGKIKLYLKNEFKFIKYLYEDKLNNIIQLIDNLISKFDINNINEDYQEIFYESQIDSIIEKYDNENNNHIEVNESNIIYKNSKFIKKLFIKDEFVQQETKNENKNNEQESNHNLFNDKIQNIEDNLEDFIINLISLNNALSSYYNSSPLLFNPLFFQEKDLEILFINLLQFCNICITIFYSITINGLGKSELDEADKTKSPPEDGKVYEGGYGMSDGAQGMENITKEIEDEEQLLGLRDENNNNNDNGEKNDKNEENNEDEEDNAFEMKNDFKEDTKKEMNDEDENGERKDNSDIEREEDEVNNNDNNKMGDEDIQDDLSEEKDEKENKKKKLDLTDKNVQIDQDKKNKNNNYKEGDNEKENDKNQNVNEDKEQQDENEEEHNEDNDDNNENGDSSEEAEKIEKLDVDKNKEQSKKEKEENNDNEEKEKEENNENNMSIEEEVEGDENNMNNDDNKDNVNKENKNDEEEDLLPENIDKENNNDIDDENDGNNEDNNSKENNENNSSDDEENMNMKIEEEEEKNDNEDENKEEKFMSNPIANKDKDLGYNPLTKNKNTQGNNTAKNTKDNLNDINEEENNNNLDFDQLEDIDKFKEIFDINSVLNNVYKKGQYENQKRKNNNKNNNKDINIENKPIEEMNEEDKVMDNDFQFENYEDKNNNDNNNYDGNIDDFEVGYNSKNNNSKDKIAREKNKEDKQKMREEKINKQEIKEKKEESNDNDEDDMNEEDIDKKEGIKVIEDVDNNNQLKEKKEIKKTKSVNGEENEEEEDEEDLSDQNENNISEEKEEKDEDMKNENENMFPMEDNKNDWDQNAIINTELKLNSNEIENDSNEKAIKLYNNYLDNSSNNHINTINDNNSPISPSLENFFNGLLSSSQSQIIKLTSLLKIILTPNLQSKFIGNYKTGKKLNMKKIISFIASNYRQDKIWLRRTLPYNRDYYITISIDNSLSMKQNNIGYYALQSMLILIKSLQKVGIDNLSLYGITDDCVELYDYNREKNLINNDKIKRILNYFKFNFESKNSFDYSIRNFLNKSIQNIENNTINDRNKLKYNINFIISDGRFNKNNVKGLTALAKEKGILYVFIIIDRYKFEDKNSILNTMTVKYNEKGDIDVEKYLADFPFQYYTVVQDIQDLPDVLKGILLKWIESVNL